jgi:hypothetical protein
VGDHRAITDDTAILVFDADAAAEADGALCTGCVGPGGDTSAEP